MRKPARFSLLLPLFPVILLGVMARAVPPGTVTDEDNVKTYPLPDPLVCADGSAVKDEAAWRTKRRPELLRLFESEVYGKTLLGRPEAMKFVLREEKKEARAGRATRLRVGVLFEGKEDGRKMELLVYLPNKAAGPCPLIFGLNFSGNHTTTDETDIPLPVAPQETAAAAAAEADRGKQAAQWQYDLALSQGFAVATAHYGEIEKDELGHAKDGVRALGPEPGPGDWGSLGAWAWASSRAVDWAETEPRVDKKRIALLGFSRLGKAALWAGAQDERFAMVVSFQSGAGGAALSKRMFGETVENLNTRFPHWFCRNNSKYSKNEEALPVDQHELLALIAPRPLLVTTATEDLWSDPRGQFLAAQAATPVYRLLGGEGLAAETEPPPEKLVDSRLGYFKRTGRHDVTRAEWEAMLAFARRHLVAPKS